MSAALDVLMVVAARVPTELLWAAATGSDAAHAPVWAFEVPDDVISAVEPGGRMSVRKITDNAASWPLQRSCYRGAHAAARPTPASRARNLAARAIAAVAVQPCGRASED